MFFIVFHTPCFRIFSLCASSTCTYKTSGYEKGYKKREKNFFSEKNAAACRMPAHIPIILNFSGKVNGKRARSIGKFFCEQLRRRGVFAGIKNFPAFVGKKTPFRKHVFMRLKRIADCRLPYRRRRRKHRRGNLHRRRARLRTERSLIIAYIVNEYPPEKSFPEGVYLCRKQKTKLISQSQAALSPSYRNRKISYFLYSRSNLQR